MKLLTQLYLISRRGCVSVENISGRENPFYFRDLEGDITTKIITWKDKCIPRYLYVTTE